MDLILFRDLAIAVLIGALVGLERERQDAPEKEHRIGGLRTFTLFALAGALSAWLARETGAHWIFATTVAAVAALVLASYVLLVGSGKATAGLTTEIAAVTVTLLGGVTLYGYPQVAVAVAIVVSALLALKQPLHGLAHRIGEDDLLAGLKLLFASFIVLPLLPDRAIDPLGALNPYGLWLLVVLISALSLVGYAAVRMLGAGVGTALTGTFGGLVSSTAVTLSFARRSKVEGHDDALAAGILLAWTVMFARVTVIAALVQPALVPPLLVPIGGMGLLTAGLALWSLRRARTSGAAEDVDVPLTNPFSLASAIRVALAFAVVLVVVKLVERYLPNEGLYLVAAVAGLTDVDAITVSLARFVADGGASALAVQAIVLAVFSNTIVKGGMVATLGSKEIRRPVLLATGFVIVAGGVALAVG